MKLVRILLLLTSALFLVVALQAQVLSKRFLRLGQQPEAMITGNNVTDIRYYNGSIWLAAGGGLSKSSDQGKSWINFREKDFNSKGGISAITFYGNSVWIATAFDTLVPEGQLPAGGGLSVSDDLGQTWRHIKQPGVTNVQNVTFDIAILDSVVWITSWGGGIKRSDDWGKTWVDNPPDTFFFNPYRRLNHRGFSVIAADSVLWVGTAEGINRSEDGGKTWVKFNHQNQEQPISGNFVVALAYQKWRDRRILWAATVEAEDPSEVRAVSFTEDQGQTWQVTLESEFAHNFAFDDSVVYVATDNGLFKSLDFGEHWDAVTEYRDKESNEFLLTEETYAVGVAPGHLVWVGTADGAALTNDGGSTWQLFRSFEPLLDNKNVSETYAYPNPFSPSRHNQFHDAGHVRIHYKVDASGPVTVRIYDFNMTLVRTVESGIFRSGPGEYDAVWDGLNGFGEKVANGVYFFQVELPGGKSAWGKLIIMD